MNDRAKVEPARQEDNGDWIDEIAGTLDEDFARAALDRPGPESDGSADHRLG